MCTVENITGGGPKVQDCEKDNFEQSGDVKLQRMGAVYQVISNNTKIALVICKKKKAMLT